MVRHLVLGQAKRYSLVASIPIGHEPRGASIGKSYSYSEPYRRARDVEGDSSLLPIAG